MNRYLDAVNGPDRLLHPLVRVGDRGDGRYARVSWDEALGRVADGLRLAIDRHGPQSVLPYYFAGSLGLLQVWGPGPRLFAHIGASRLATTICTAAASKALAVTVGGDIGFDPEDVEHARLVIFWGSNPLATNIHQWRPALEARRRGAPIVVIDPIRSPSAESSDWHLAPIPGTDAALALGLMRGLLDVGAADIDYLDRHTIGWPLLRERLGEWSLERAAGITGLALADVTRLRDLIAEHRPTAFRVGLGLQRNGGGGSIIRTLMALPAVTGDWRYVGGGAICMTGDLLPALSPVRAAPDLARLPARTINMSRLGEALTELTDPHVAALVVWSTNPAATAPDQHRVRAGLMRDDLFTVVIEQRMTDTADLADVILPTTMQPEHHDLVAPYGQLHLSWNEAAVEPPGECLSTSEVFRRLARELGLDHPRLQESDIDLADAILAAADAPPLAEWRERGFVRCGPPRGTAPFAEGGWPTPSGKVELWSQHLADEGLDGLVGFQPPHEILDADLATRFPLVLVAPAGRFYMNSTFASLPWHSARMDGPRLYLHPSDAAARSIATGDAVDVANDRGSCSMHAVVTDAVRPGVCFTLKVEWPKRSPGGLNANATTPIRDADYGGSPTFHDNRVEVRGRASSAPPPATAHSVVRA